MRKKEKQKQNNLKKGCVCNAEQINNAFVQEKVTVLCQEIELCKSEITGYNNQFVTSSVFGILATVAAAGLSVVGGAEKTNNELISGVILILPTIHFLCLYNLLKYTYHQMLLAKYVLHAETKLCSIIGLEEFKLSRHVLRNDKNVVLLGGVFQVFFYVPLTVIILVLVWQQPHSVLWWILAVFDSVQIGFIVLMCIKLIIITRQYKTQQDK